MTSTCKICGGIKCVCKKSIRELEQEKAEQATYENNSNTGGIVIDDTNECESCQ